MVSGRVVRRGALGLSLYLALHNYQVDIDVYRMGGQHVLSPDLYSAQFGNSGLLFTYTPFAALVFALLGLNLGLWTLQCLWAVTNIVALAALIYLSIRIVVPRLQRKQVVRSALLLVLPALALNPVFTTVGLGQIDLVLCLLITWDLGTNRRIGSHTVPLGIATGLAAAMKLTPLIFVPYLIITRRGRGALNALVTFIACQAIAFLVTPGDSWTYWTKDVLDSKRAGALLYIERPEPVERFAEVASRSRLRLRARARAAGDRRRRAGTRSMGASAVVGRARASGVRDDRPDHFAHHLGPPHGVGGPVIIWLAAGPDPAGKRPVAGGIHCGAVRRRPIWWVPTSWKVTEHPPELHQNRWQLFVGNSFLFAMLAFLAGVAVMLVRRRVQPRGLSPPNFLTVESGERFSVACDHGRAAPRLDEDAGHPRHLVTVGAPDVDPTTEDLELVGSERSEGPADHTY